jgi:sugar (pentulose or hexulose) kinase
MAETFFLLLDLGSTNLKIASVATGTTRLQKIVTAELPEVIENEISIREMYPHQILSLCKEKILEALIPNSKYSGIFISGQMGGWVLTDTFNRPITNLVSWQDLRSSKDTYLTAEENHFNLDIFQDKVFLKNGYEMRPGLPILGLLSYLAKEEISEPRIRFHSIISWICAALSKDYRFVVHDTDAAASGFYDILSKTWLNGKFYGAVENLDLPIVTNKIIPIGFNDVVGCLVFCGVGDQQSSLLGINLLESETAINIGTGGQVARLSENFLKSGVQFRPYFQNTTLVTMTHLPAGRMMSAFLQFLKGSQKDEDFAWMNDQALTKKPIKGLEIKDYNLQISKLLIEDIGMKSERYASGVIYALVLEYCNALAMIGHVPGSVLLFGGGAGTKMSSISKLIGQETKSEVRFATTQETTLQGLANLTFQVKNY